MKEQYLEPELNIICFASAQRLAFFEGGEGDEASIGGDDDGNLDLDIT